MPTTVQIAFEPTPAGVSQAQADLDRFRALLDSAEEKAQPRAKDKRPSVAARRPAQAVFEGTGEHSRTRELLVILPGDITEAMTPEGIGEELTPNDDGSALSSAQARAVLRNVRRVESHLKERGVIDREVVRVDWNRYDAEGCGRYDVSPKDREELDALI